MVAIFLLALFVRLLIATLLTQYVSGHLVFDDTTYHLMAAQMAERTTSHWDQFTHTLYWSTATLLLPVTFLYRIFGPEMIIGQIYVAIVGATAAGLATRLAMGFLATGWAMFAGAVVALLPSQALWSSLLMKDAAVWAVLLGLALTVAIAATSRGWRLALMGVLAGVLLILLSFLRLHTLVVASSALMLASLVGVKSQRWPRIGGALLLGVTIPWFAGQIGPAGLSLVLDHGSLEDRRFANAVGANTAIVGTGPRPGDGVNDGSMPADPENEEVSRRRIEQIGELRGDPGLLVDERQGIVRRGEQRRPVPDSGLLDPNVAHLPRGLSVMLVEPLPIPFSGSLSLRLARLESVLWYPILGLALIGVWRSRLHLRILAFPVLAGIAILFMYALTEGNVGTAHRHRGEFVWVVAVLAALGASQLRGGLGSEEVNPSGSRHK